MRIRSRFQSLRVIPLEDRSLPSSVQGTVFNDGNNNGVFDSGETGVASWNVYVDNNRNLIQDPGEPSSVTDINGHYLIDVSSVTPSGNGFNYFNLDLQVGSGGRWLRTTAANVYAHPINEPNAVRDFGVHFEPYTSVEPDGPETRINVATAGTQDFVTVASDSAGNYAMAWRSISASGNQTVMLRVFNADGSPRTGEITVASATNVYLPFIDMSDNGKIAVAWNSATGSAPWSVYSRLYTLNGTAATGVIGVAVAKPNDFHSVDGVAMDADGDFAVLYFSMQPRRTIKVQRYTAAGAENGKVIQVDQPNHGNGRNQIGMDAAGNFTVVWEGTGANMYAQRYGNNGKTIGSRISVTSSNVGYTSAAMNRSGQWVAAWLDFNTYENKMRLMQPNGTPAGPVVTIDAGYSGLTIDDAGTVTMSWTDAYGDVRFTRLVGGTTLEPASMVNTTMSGGQYADTYENYPQYSGGLAATGNDRFVVAWHGDGPGDDAGIFTQRFKRLGMSPIGSSPPKGGDGQSFAIFVGGEQMDESVSQPQQARVETHRLPIAPITDVPMPTPSADDETPWFTVDSRDWLANVTGEELINDFAIVGL